MGRKQLQINKRHITEITSLVDDAIETCKDQAVLDKLRPLAKKVESLYVSDSKKLITIDEEIISAIKDLRVAIKNGSENTERNLMEKLSVLFDKRENVCPSNFEFLTKSERKVAKRADKQIKSAKRKRVRELEKHGSIEDFKTQIDKFADENAAIKKQCFNIFNKLKETDDQSEAKRLESDLKILNGQMQFNMSYIDDLLAAIERVSAEEFLNKQESIARRIEQVAPFKDEELIARMKKVIKEKERTKRSQKIVNKILTGAMGAEVQEASVATSAPSAASVATSAPSAASVATTAPSSAFFATTAPVVSESEWKNPYTDKDNPYGPSSPQHSKVEDFYEDVDEQAGLLRGAIKEVQREIDKKETELHALSEEIKQLLKQRKGASAAECVTLDGTIDHKYSEYSKVKKGIDRLNQERAKYSIELNIVDQIKDIRNEAERNKRIEEVSGGRFRDIAALATAVNEDTARKNEIIAEARDAMAVANATPIDSKTFAETGVTYENDVKDEDKYAGMEKEFGLRV